MADDEQFSLCWNNFNTNLSAGFHESLCRGDLVDVTLAAEGQLVKAHRLVLSVCSPYFRKMFTQMPANQHAFVFLKDVSHSALKDLIQFMYCGEVNVKQDALPAFISTAEALQIKGLTETGETSAPQQSPAKESTIVPNVPSSASPRSKPQRNRIQSYKVESEESSDEKIVAHNVQVQSQKRTVQRSVTPQSMPVLKRAKITSDPLESPESTIQTVHIVKQQVQSTEPEYVELPIETINPKSEPEYVEDTSEIEAGDQEQEQEQEAHEIQEQDDAHNYVEDESYGDIKYDESYFTENDEVKAGVSGFSESYVEGDQSASEAQDNEITRDVLSDLNEKNLQSNLPLGPRIKLVKSLSESNTAPLENIQTDKSSQSSSSFSAKVNDQRVNIKEVLKNDLPLIYSNKLIPQKDVTSADVSQIVRSLTKKLAQATDYYPTATEKENLAKDLVELFPESFKKYSLFCKEGAEKPPSYALFYWKNGPQNRSTGKIENALQTLRRQLPLESKKQTKRSAQRLTKYKMSAEKEASLLHINELKANAENKIKIMETMDSLYKYRRQMIQQKCSISELLAAYPHITEYGGEVIRNDFAKQFPAAKSFKNFLNYVGIINTMVNKWDEVQNHTIRAILNIFSFLANRGLQKRIDETSVLTQKEQEISDLIVYIQPGTDMHGYIQKKKSNFPYIICRGTSKFKEGNYYIIMGDKYIFMEYDAHLSFDVMFQLYHIMELKYPPFFKKTFEFMGSFIYQCEKSSSQCIQNLIRRLERNTSVNTDNEDDEQDEDDGSDSDSD